MDSPVVKDVAVNVLQSLMDQDQNLAIAYVKEQQIANPDRLQLGLLPFVPRLVKAGAIDCLKHIQDNTWQYFCCAQSLLDVRNNLLGYFPGNLRTQLDCALNEGQKSSNAAAGVYTLLELLVEQHITGYEEDVGEVFARLPKEIFNEHVLPKLTMCSELALSATCQHLNRMIEPGIRERYMTLERSNNKFYFQFSLIKLHDALLKEGRKDYQASIKKIMRKHLEFRAYEPEIFYGAEVKSLGQSNDILKDLVLNGVDAEVLVLLIRAQAAHVLKALKYQSVVTVWLLSYPESVVQAIIQNATTLPSDILFIIDDMRFSQGLKQLLLNRVGMKFTEQQYNYLLSRIPYRSMLEEVLMHFSNDEYLLSAMQIHHFLKLNVSIDILNTLLKEVEADIRNDGLMQKLLAKKVAEVSLVTQLRYPKATCIYSKQTLQLAIEHEYSEELIGMIIRMARNSDAMLYTEPLSLDSYTSSDMDVLDIIL